MFLGPGSCYYSGSLDHCFSFVELHCKKSKKNKPLSALPVPPTSTWIIQSTSASASRQPGHQGIWPSWSQSLPVGFVSWISLAQFLPRWVSAVLRCHRGLKGIFFFLQERGSLLIWLLRDSTGVQTSRQSGHRYRWRRGRGRVTAVFGFLCLYGEGVRGQMERLEENISDISSGWLMGSHSCRQATWAVLLCILWVIYANILTFDLYISLGKYDSQLWFFKSRITIFFLLSNWSLKISGMNPICAKSPLNSG